MQLSMDKKSSPDCSQRPGRLGHSRHEAGDGQVTFLESGLHRRIIDHGCACPRIKIIGPSTNHHSQCINPKVCLPRQHENRRHNPSYPAQIKIGLVGKAIRQHPRRNFTDDTSRMKNTFQKPNLPKGHAVLT